MNHWMTVAAAAALLAVALPLWMWLAMARSLAQLRLQPVAVQVLDRAAVPAPHRGILDAAAGDVMAMGFTYAYSLQCSPTACIAGMPWVYSDVYVSADGCTQLQVSPSTLPEAGRACTFQWATVWADAGPHDLTVHCFRHFLLWWPATWQVHDDYLPSVPQAWAGHQRRVEAARAAGRQPVTDVAAVREVCLGLLQGMLPEGQARGYLTPIPEPISAPISAPVAASPLSEAAAPTLPLWRMRGWTALRQAPTLVRGMRRAAQVMARSPVPAASFATSAPLSDTASPAGVDAALHADLQAFAQHQSHQAEVAARPRRKWLALGTTAALFVLVGGVLMSWRSALVLLVVIGLHEGGHWLAMRTLGYRNLSVLFIPGLGGVALGHKPSASTWNKLAVYLAGPVPGLLLAMGLMGALAKGWLAPSAWVPDFVLMCLIINYLNLLPVHPLDGGRVVESLLFVRWPVLRFVFVLAGMVALGALGWLLHDAITLALAGLLAMGLPYHWRLMRVDRQVPRPAAGQALTEAEAATRVFTALQQPQFARWSFAQRLGAVRALLPELQGTRLGLLGTLAGLALYLACLALPAAALWATGAGPLFMAARSAPQYLPDVVDEKSPPTYSAPASGFVTPEEWTRRLEKTDTLPESQRLPLYVEAADDALELEDTQAALDRYQQAWALAEPLPASNPLRARTLLGLLQATEDPQESRAWGLRLLAEMPANADASLRLLQARAESSLAHSAASLNESIEHMQRALALWEAAEARPPAGPPVATRSGLSPSFYSAATARSVLSRWRMQQAGEGDAQEAKQEAQRLLQRNVDAWPTPAEGDRSRGALAARVGRADAQLDLAWLLLDQGATDRAVPLTQQVLAQVPAPVTASWVHLQDRALETLVWSAMARQDPASLRAHWQAWLQSARNTASPRRDALWQLDRWAVMQRLGDTGQAQEARADILRRAKPGAYWAMRWCGPPASAPQVLEVPGVRELARREAAQVTGLCERMAEPAGTPQTE